MRVAVLGAGALALIASLTSGLVATAPPGSADDQFGSCDVVSTGRQWCRTDSNPMDWCLTDSMDPYPRMRDAAAKAMERLDAATNINSGAATTCNPNIDAKWRQNANLGNDTQGRSFCQDWHTTPGGLRCNASQVELNINGIRSAQSSVLFNDDGSIRSDARAEGDEIGFNLDKTACHELGHAVGMPHRERESGYFTASGNDCSVSGWLDLPEEAGMGWISINFDHRLDINKSSY